MLSGNWVMIYTQKRNVQTTNKPRSPRSETSTYHLLPFWRPSVPIVYYTFNTDLEMIRSKLFTHFLTSDKPLHPIPYFPLECGNNFYSISYNFKELWRECFLTFPRTFELLLLEIRYQFFKLNLEKFMQYVSMLSWKKPWSLLAILLPIKKPANFWFVVMLLSLEVNQLLNCRWIHVLTLIIEPFCTARGRILGRNWHKSLKSFPPCYSQSRLLRILLPPPPWAKWLETGCNVNIVYGNLNKIVRSWFRLQEKKVASSHTAPTYESSIKEEF